MDWSKGSAKRSRCATWPFIPQFGAVDRRRLIPNGWLLIFVCAFWRLFLAATKLQNWRLGKQWSGTSYIDGKYVNPAWSPPDDIRRDKPGLPAVIPGGSPKNPMGVAAMTLHGGQYAIHGTNQPGSIGGFVSYGCIRMYNADVSDLFGRVGYGTQVVVTR